VRLLHGHGVLEHHDREKDGTQETLHIIINVFNIIYNYTISYYTETVPLNIFATVPEHLLLAFSIHFA
jgi:hypothetical protein